MIPKQKTLFDGRVIVTPSDGSYTLTASQFINQGQEAEIYEISKTTAAKIYKDPEKALRLRDKLTILLDPNLKIHDTAVLPRSLTRFADNNAPCGFTLKLVNNARPLIPDFSWKPGLNQSEEAELDTINSGLLFDLCDAMNALHDNRIFYSDLKPDNILVADQRAYLVDFDSCSIPGYPGNCITIDYVDPLLRRSDPTGRGPYSFSAGSDWWALAVIAFELFMGVSPWEGRHPNPRYNVEGYRSFDYIAVGLDPAVRVPGPRANPFMRPMDWLGNKQKLLRFFRDIFSPNKRRISIEGAMETYFPRPESRVLTSSLSQRLDELGLLKQKSGEEDLLGWGELSKHMKQVSRTKGDAKAEGRERFLTLMLGR